jgi:hypothetical protein
LQAFERISGSGNESPEQLKGIEEVLSTTNEFRSAFLKFYYGFGNPMGEPLPESIRPATPNIQMFSDSVVVSTPFGNQPLPSEYGAFLGLILGCVGATVVLLEKGILVRGGIAWGYGAKTDFGDVIGSGLVKAYGLENDPRNRAPRIVVDPKLVDPQGPFCPCAQMMPSDSSQTFWTKILSMLPCDSDGQRFIDFLHPWTYEIVAESVGPLYPLARVLGIREVVDNNLCRPVGHQSKLQRRIREKWQWVDNLWMRHWGQMIPPVESDKVMR